MRAPLIIMIFAFLAFAVSLTLAGMRADVFRRRVLAAQRRRARSAA
jgi:hypothetical protein